MCCRTGRARLWELPRLGREEEHEQGKMAPKARREGRGKHECTRRGMFSRCFYSKRAHSVHLNKIFTLLM